MSRPSFQFYHGDWISNAKLRRCTHEEKGVWIDCLCLMADSDEFGIIRWPLKELAQAVGARVGVLQSLIRKGVLKGAEYGQTCETYQYVPRSGRKDGEPVALIAEQNGPIWYSSKQVRDDYIARIKAANARGSSSPSLSKGESKDASLGGESVEQKSLPPTPSPSPPPGLTYTSLPAYLCDLPDPGQGKKRRTPKTPIPVDWFPKQQTIESLSLEYGLRDQDVDRYVSAFRDACKAKGYEYVDFDAAFRNCVRNDWPKLRANGALGMRPRSIV